MLLVPDAQEQPNEMEGIYVISVAARILDMHPQTLRKYERVGFVLPSRTGGKLRLYSEADIVRLRLIKHLATELGLNIAGVQLALQLFNHMLGMKVQLDRLQGPALKRALNESLDDMFELMHVR